MIGLITKPIKPHPLYLEYLDWRNTQFYKKTGIHLTYSQLTQLELHRAMKKDYPKIPVREALEILGINGFKVHKVQT